jgi:hypothetical protein
MRRVAVSSVHNFRFAAVPSSLGTAVFDSLGLYCDDPKPLLVTDFRDFIGNDTFARDGDFFIVR